MHLRKTHDHPGRGNFDPRAKILIIFLEVHQKMFHVKYLRFSLKKVYRLGGEIFLVFTIYVYIKEINDPLAGPILSPGL